MTENHGYETPSEGVTNWDEPLNRNFERLETDIEVRDTDANRGNYTPHSGATFLATDTRTVYVGDGSAWQRLGTLRTLGGNLYVRGESPSGASNDLWVDTSERTLTVQSEGEWQSVEVATPSTVLEGFERDAPLSDYRGDTGSYQITTGASEVRDGSAALKTTADDRVIFYDGTDASVTTDRTYEVFVRQDTDDASKAGIVVMGSGTAYDDFDGYWLNVDNRGSASGGQGIALTKVTGGSRDEIDVATFSVPDGEYLRTEFSVDTSTSPNTITANVYDESETLLGTVRAQDGSYSSGAFGFCVNDYDGQGATKLFDTLRKTADTPL